MERYGPGLVTVDRPPGRLAERTRQLLWGTFHCISLRKMTRQNGSQLVSELVLMFPAEIRGQDVKLSANLRVNLSPLTSGSCGTITKTLASSSDLSLRLRPFFPPPLTSLQHWSTHARAQFRKTNETEKPQTFPISQWPWGLEVKYWILNKILRASNYRDPSALTLALPGVRGQVGPQFIDHLARSEQEAVLVDIGELSCNWEEGKAVLSDTVNFPS